MDSTDLSATNTIDELRELARKKYIVKRSNSLTLEGLQDLNRQLVKQCLDKCLPEESSVDVPCLLLFKFFFSNSYDPEESRQFYQAYQLLVNNPSRSAEDHLFFCLSALRARMTSRLVDDETETHGRAIFVHFLLTFLTTFLPEDELPHVAYALVSKLSVHFNKTYDMESVAGHMGQQTDVLLERAEALGEDLDMTNLELKSLNEEVKAETARFIAAQFVEIDYFGQADTVVLDATQKSSTEFGEILMDPEFAQKLGDLVNSRWTEYFTQMPVSDVCDCDLDDEATLKQAKIIMAEAAAVVRMRMEDLAGVGIGPGPDMGDDESMAEDKGSADEQPVEFSESQVSVMIEWMQRRGYVCETIAKDVEVSLMLLTEGVSVQFAARLADLSQPEVESAFKRFREFWADRMYPVLVNMDVGKCVSLKSTVEHHQDMKRFFGDSLVGAIDGFTVQTTTPHKSPTVLKNLIIVDDSRRVLFSRCGMDKDTSNKNAYKIVTEIDYFSDNWHSDLEFSRPFDYVMADLGFSNQLNVLLPCRGYNTDSEATREKGEILLNPRTIFNFYQDSYRTVVNHAIDDIKAKFSWIGRPLRCKSDDVPTVLRCVFALYNFSLMFPQESALLERFDKKVADDGNLVRQDSVPEEKLSKIPCGFWTTYMEDWYKMGTLKCLPKAEQLLGGEIPAKQFAEFARIQEQLFASYLKDKSLEKVGDSRRADYAKKRNRFIVINAWMYYYLGNKKAYPNLPLYDELYYT